MKLRLIPIFLALAGTTAFAQLVNPGFESGDLTGWSAVGTASAVTSFDTGLVTLLPNEGGHFAVLSTAGASSSIGDLETFLGLSPGTFASLNPSPGSGAYEGGAAIDQSAYLTAGEKVDLDLQFATTDYLPFVDSAFFTVTGAGFQRAQLFASVGTVGSYGNTGWQSVSFTAPQSGEYILGASVLNFADGENPSYLGVDASGTAPASSPVPESSTYGWVGVVVLVCILVWNRRPRSQPDSEI